MLAQTLFSPPLGTGQAIEGNLVTEARELPADLETPVSVYLKLAGLPSATAAATGRRPSFLLESVTGGEHVARYSFIAAGVQRAYLLNHGQLLGSGPEGVRVLPFGLGKSPLDALRAEMAQYIPGDMPGALAGAARGGARRPFAGGLVGYLAYEAARYFEPKAFQAKAPAGLPDYPEAVFLLADTLVAFDHAYGTLLLIANEPVGTDGAAARARAEARLDEMAARLAGPLPEAEPAAGMPEQAGSGPVRLDPAGSDRIKSDSAGTHSNMSPAEFMAAVAAAKDHIAAGDVFQVVLSQRFSRRTSAAPFAIYRTLRRVNPSPYMFFFDFTGLPAEPFYLIGASPEMHVRLESAAAAGAPAAAAAESRAAAGHAAAGRRATLRPIAGTRPRGASEPEDQALEVELMADPKERAEHVMLVDLARNDLGRVCEYGSVRLPELMAVERYSHVMHIVSQVEGELRPEQDAFDLLAATFPAGTVSGAPKIRAMQIIGELERQARGPYAGAVGHFGFDGSLDTCITIRTLVMHGDTVSVQAGAGIVADSEPEREYQETVNKARALLAAVAKAEA